MCAGCLTKFDLLWVKYELSGRSVHCAKGVEQKSTELTVKDWLLRRHVESRNTRENDDFLWIWFGLVDDAFNLKVERTP